MSLREVTVESPTHVRCEICGDHVTAGHSHLFHVDRSSLRFFEPDPVERENIRRDDRRSRELLKAQGGYS